MDSRNKLIRLAVIMLVLSASLVYAACPDGMVSYWKGENNANDEKGLNPGTFAANTYADGVPGIGGKAFSLNGASDYINLGTSKTLEPAQFAVEAWIKLDQPVPERGYATVLSNGYTYANNRNGAYLAVTNNDDNIYNGEFRGKYGTAFATLDGNGPGWLAAGSTNSADNLNTGAWYHVAGTYDGVNLKVYINGVLKGQRSVSQLYYNSGLVKKTVGAYLVEQDGWLGNRLYGQIDEVAVYSRALTATGCDSVGQTCTGGEIKDHYNGGTGKDYCIAGAPPEPCPSGMVSYWRGEGNAQDSSGNGNTGQLMYGTTFSLPIYGSSLIYRSELDTAADTTSFDTSHPIGQSGSVIKVEIYARSTNPFKLKIFRETPTGVFTQVGESEMFYPPSTGVQLFTLANPISVQAGDLIGWYIPSTGTMPFSYNEGSNFSWAWGDQATITLGGNLVSSVDRTYSIRVYLSGQGGGKVGTAFRFDGADDYALSTSNIPVSGSASLSMETWFKMDSDATFGDGTLMRPDSNGGTDMNLRVDSYGGSYKLSCGAGILCSGGSGGSSTQVLSKDTWYHAAFTYDGATRNISLYLNGHLEMSNIVPSQYIGGTINRPFRLGSHGDCGGANIRNFDGLIDEAAVYNRVLTQEEITAHYNNGTGKDYCTAGAPPNPELIQNSTGGTVTAENATVTVPAGSLNTEELLVTIVPSTHSFAPVSGTTVVGQPLDIGPQCSEIVDQAACGSTNGCMWNVTKCAFIRFILPVTITMPGNCSPGMNLATQKIAKYTAGSWPAVVNCIPNPKTQINGIWNCTKDGRIAIWNNNTCMMSAQTMSFSTYAVVEETSACPDGMISYWKGEGDASDVKGLNNGVWQGTASYATNGKVGQALNLNGNNYVDITTNSFPFGNSPRSIEAWVNPADCSRYMMPLYYGNAGYTQQMGVGLWCNTNNAIGFSGYNFEYGASKQFSSNTWYYVVETFDGTTVKIYVDDQLLGQSTTTTYDPFNTNSPLSNLATVSGSEHAIGYASWWGMYSIGKIDEVAIYDRVLTDGGCSVGQTCTGGEIAAHYNNGQGKDYCAAAAPPEPPANCFYSENFSSGTAQGWQPLEGTWGVQNNEYVGTFTSNGPYGWDRSISNVGAAWTDYVYTAKVRLVNDLGFQHSALFFRVKDSNNFYEFFIRKEGSTNMAFISKVVGGSRSDITSVGTSYDWEVGQTHTLKVVVQGSTMTGYIDGAQVISASESSIPNGGIGAGVYQCGTAFDDLSVEAIGDEGACERAGAPPAEVCDNSIDDDEDGLTDCADTADCAADPACQAEVCLGRITGTAWLAAGGGNTCVIESLAFLGGNLVGNTFTWLTTSSGYESLVGQSYTITSHYNYAMWTSYDGDGGGLVIFNAPALVSGPPEPSPVRGWTFEVCPPEPVCGNNVINGAEECDGSDLNGQTCATYGYDGGLLGCTQDCHIDYSVCYNYPTESTFTIGNAIADPGGSVDITISLFNGDSIAGMQFIFQHPGLLQYQGIDSTSRTSSGTIAVNPGVPGSETMRFAALYGITPSTQLDPGIGEIYTLHFTVSEDAVSGEYPLTFATVKVGDISANQLPYAVVDGVLTVRQGAAPDTEAPSSSAAFSGTLQNGWFTSDVTAEIVGTDNVAVASMYYCLSTPSAPIECNPSQYTQVDSSYVTFNIPAAGNGGASTLYYYAVDTSDNAESVKTAAFQIDATAPTTSDNLPPWWINYDLSITIDASDAQSGVSATYLCIASTPSCTPTIEPPQYSLGDGIYFIRYYSVDRAGNAEGMITKAISIDRTMPVTSAAVASTFNAQGWTNAPVDITLSGVDPGSAADPEREGQITGSGLYATYQCTSFEGNGCSAYTQTDVPGQGHQLISGEGRFVYRFYSEDNGGRISPYSEGYTYSSYDAPNTGNAESVKEMAVNIDMSAPNTTMASSCSSASCAITLSAIDPALISGQDGSGVQKIIYAAEGGEWQEYSGQFTVTGEGRNYILFYALDNAGNVEEVQQTVVIIDNTPPVLTATKIGTEGKNGWYVSPVTVVVKATESASDITEVCSDVDGSNVTCGKNNCETGAPPVVAACPDSMVSYWKFDDSNSIGKDSKGANDCTPQGSYTWDAQGSSNGALLLDGNGYLDCGNAASVQLGTGSIEAWVKTSNAGGSYRGVVVKQLAYSLFMQDNEAGSYDWTQAWFGSGVYTNDGNWHHLVLSFQNGVSSGTRIYVDGVLRRIMTYSILSQDNYFTIGSGARDTSQAFSGYIDEAALYNNVLTDGDCQVGQTCGGEIAEHYNSGAAGYCETD